MLSLFIFLNVLNLQTHRQQSEQILRGRKDSGVMRSRTEADSHRVRRLRCIIS